MTLKDAYLILYNSGCSFGWMVVWFIAVVSIVDNVSSLGIVGSLANIYNDPQTGSHLALALAVVQTAALMEIIHAMLKLVRSPVLVTAMQVMSRIVALFAIYFSKNAQNQWGAGLMILSWASVEVPRYAFYVAALITGDATKKTPFPLFWLRYSLFAILYPTGIIGELTVFFAAANDPAFVARFTAFATFYYAKFLPIIYIFGSPFMIMNMVGNRKSAFKKRFARPAPPPRGLSWPVTDATTTPQPTRGSTETNVAIIAAALGAVSAEKAKAASQARGWRFTYWKYIKSIVEEQCKSPEAALQVAEAGLNKAYELFEFIAPDGTAVSLKDAMTAKNSMSFYTGTVQGQNSTRLTKFEVPYKGRVLSGQELKDQVQKWVDYGTIEASAGVAIKSCVDHPEWIEKTIQDRYFVLLGAGSAMGPLHVLLAMGANIVAIDLDRPHIWKRLITLTKGSAGSITFPLAVDPKTLDPNDEDALCNAAGCNLFTHTPMIRDWLMQLKPGKPFAVGCYAYLDGALHVQVSLAMDAICRDLSEKRPNTSLAYLCTPTDLHLIPKEVHDVQEANFKEYSKRLYCTLLRLFSNGKFLKKNAHNPFISAKGDEYYYVNGISVAQGPNYILAKRMQHWRAIIARSKGCIVSSNVAPSTSTASVVHNRTFAWAYEGMPYFKPFEIFAPETSNAVMSAILFYDLNETASSANPQTKFANPNQLFSYGSFHGGLWRCAYEVTSIGEASVLLYFSRVAAPYVYTVCGAVVAVGVSLYIKSS